MMILSIGSIWQNALLSLKSFKKRGLLTYSCHQIVTLLSKSIFLNYLLIIEQSCCSCFYSLRRCFEEKRIKFYANKTPSKLNIVFVCL